MKEYYLLSPANLPLRLPKSIRFDSYKAEWHRGKYHPTYSVEFGVWK